MIKVSSESHFVVLSGRREKVKSDSAVRSELGWGSHTMETIIITFIPAPPQTISRSTANIPSPREPQVLVQHYIRSHAAVYVAKDHVVVLLGANNPLDTASYASKRKDDKYVIPLLDVVHIDVGASNEDHPISSGSNRGRAIPSSQVSESRKLFTKIHLRGGAACILETFHSNHIGRAIISSWHSALVRKSADVRKVDAPVNIALASSYYSETVKSMHEARTQTEAMEIAEDFSEEVLSDVHLKDVFFRSRELLMTSIALLKYTLTAPPDYNNDFPTLRSVAEAAYAPTFASTPVRSSLDTTSGAVMSMERKNKLRMILLHRLKLAFVIIKMLLSVFFCSECLISRLGVLMGPSPLDLDTWAEILVPDFYDRICRLFGIPDSTQEEEEEAVDKMLHTERPSGLAAHRSSGALTSRTALITPRLTTTQERVSEAFPLKEYKESLDVVRQSVADVQVILLNELFRIFSLGRTLGKNDKYSKSGIVLDHMRYASRLKDQPPAGDIFSRYSGWEDTLENLVSRVSTVMEDILGSENITVHYPLQSNLSEVFPGSHQRDGDGDGAVNDDDDEEDDIYDDCVVIASTENIFHPLGVGNNNNNSSSGNLTRNPSNQSLRIANFDIASMEQLSLTDHIEHRYRYNHLSIPPSPKPTPRQSNPIPPQQLSARGKANVSRLALTLPHPSLPTPRSQQTTPRITATPRLSSSRYSSTNVNNSESTPRFTFRTNLLVDASAGTQTPRPSAALKSTNISMSIAENSPYVESTEDMLLEQRPSPVPFLRKKHSSNMLLHGINGADAIGLGVAGIGLTDRSERSITGESRKYNFYGSVDHDGLFEDELFTHVIGTQEILLFYITSLLRMLAFDSAKIREWIKSSCSHMLLSIMSIFNLICPRPTEKATTAMAQKATDDTIVADRPSSISKPTTERKKGFVNKLINMLSSSSSAASKPSETTTEKSPPHHSREEVTLTEPLDMDALKVFDYGPPKFGLSEATWNLLILARKAVEDIVVRLAIPASFTCSTTSLGPLPTLNLPLHTHRPSQLPHRSSGVGSKMDLNSSTSSIPTLPHRDMSFHTPTHSYSLPLQQQHAPHSTGYYIASPDTAHQHHHHRLVPQLSHRHLNLSPSPLASFMSPDAAAVSLTRLRSNSRLAESDDSGDHESASCEDRLMTHRTGFSDIFS